VFSSRLQQRWKDDSPERKGNLFAFEVAGKRSDQLGESGMTGPGTAIFAGGGAQSRYDLGNAKLPKLLLICTNYVDDNDNC
jgi:hypothetical protein